jgi:seryl-tRNA synthetase
MAAKAEVLETSLDKLDANVRAQGEQAIAHVKQCIAEGQAEIKNVQAKGEASIAEAKAHIEAAWSQFHNESDTWVEVAKDEQAAFQARAQAQAQSWQDVVNSYVQLAAEVHAQNKERPRRISTPRSMILARLVRRHGRP